MRRIWGKLFNLSVLLEKGFVLLSSVTLNRRQRMCYRLRSCLDLRHTLLTIAVVGFHATLGAQHPLVFFPRSVTLREPIIVVVPCILYVKTFIGPRTSQFCRRGNGLESVRWIIW